MRLRKAFANNSSANIKLSKTQLSKIVQLEGLLGKLFGPLLKTDLSIIENVPKSLAKSVLIAIGLTAAASATDAVIQKKVYGSAMITLIISNEEMDVIMKIIKSLKESDLLIKRVSEAIKNETNEQQCGFIGMLLGI